MTETKINVKEDKKYKIYYIDNLCSTGKGIHTIFRKSEDMTSKIPVMKR